MNGELQPINPLVGYIENPRSIAGTLDGTLIRGYSAYEIYLQQGGTLSKEEWLQSLHGHDPVITAERTAEKETTIYADGTEIAKIQDGIGVPAGGTTGQILTKKSVVDGDTEWQDVNAVIDVTINGASLVNEETKIANIPIAGADRFGVIKVADSGEMKGMDGLTTRNQRLSIFPATIADVKNPSPTSLAAASRPIVPDRLNAATFYGLARAAGDKTQSQSSNAIGTYTEEAKTAIQSMLGIDTAISDAIGNITGFDFEIVNTLPASGEKGIIYLVAHSHGDNDAYDEYIWINNGYEKIGNTDIDLSGYATTTYVDTELANKQDIISDIDTIRSSVDKLVSRMHYNRLIVIDTMRDLGDKVDAFSQGMLILDSSISPSGKKAYCAYISYGDGEYGFYWAIEITDMATGKRYVTWSKTYFDWAPWKEIAVMNLGEGLLQIDDTQATATNPWSGQKVNTELANKQNAINYGTPTSADIGKALMPKVISNGEVIEWEFGESGSIDDVQIDGASVVQNGVANIPQATRFVSGVIKMGGTTSGITLVNGGLYTVPANQTQTKDGYMTNVIISPAIQHESVFYGLAKIAGHDEKDSTSPVGTYTEGAKSAIQTMLGLNNKIEAPATAGTSGQVLTSDGNGGQTWEDPSGTVTDVQINSTSILDANGVAKIPVASGNDFGVVKVDASSGITIDNAGKLRIEPAAVSTMKTATGYKSLYQAVVPNRQHASVFYGLAKAAGDATQAQSSNDVGTYTDDAKLSIQSMLGVPASDIIAPQFDSSLNYSVGDYVIDEGKLYRFTASHSTGALDGSDTEEVTIGEEFINSTIAITNAQIDALFA